jgi:DNA-binding transcriptional LysR family regulator
VELRQLRYFTAIADRLSFTRAAEDLVIAQPALSAQIQKLEAEVGAALFVRDKRHVELTDVGRRVLAEARLTLVHADRALKTGFDGAHGITGRLRIGYNRVFPLLELSRCVRDFRDVRPHVDVALVQARAAEMLEAIRGGTMDAGLVLLPEDPLPDDIHVYRMLSSGINALLPADHPLAARTSIALTDLRDDGFVLVNTRDGFECQYDMVLRSCRAAGFVPHVEQEVAETRLVFGLVAAGIGVSLISSALNETQIAGVVRVPVEPSKVLEYGLMWSNELLNPAFPAFLETVQKVAAES